MLPHCAPIIGGNNAHHPVWMKPPCKALRQDMITVVSHTQWKHADGCWDLWIIRRLSIYYKQQHKDGTATEPTTQQSCKNFFSFNVWRRFSAVKTLKRTFDGCENTQPVLISRGSNIYTLSRLSVSGTNEQGSLSRLQWAGGLETGLSPTRPVFVSFVKQKVWSYIITEHHLVINLTK